MDYGNRMLAFCDDKELWTEIFEGQFGRYDKFRRMLMEGRFFVTKGIFGCALTKAVKQNQVVNILGGAYVPYLLEKCESYYKPISHVYVEETMNVGSLPANCNLTGLGLDRSFRGKPPSRSGRNPMIVQSLDRF
jgi:hypothetical protein